MPGGGKEEEEQNGVLRVSGVGPGSAFSLTFLDVIILPRYYNFFALHVIGFFFLFFFS